MSERICSVDGCDKSAVTRGWCGAHYSRWRRHGDPNAPRRKAGPGPRNPEHCVVDGCDGPGRAPGTAHGYCKRHWYRWQTYGDPLAEPRQAAPYGDTPCSVDGCTRAVLARGWCTTHYSRWVNHGDPTKMSARATALRRVHEAEVQTGLRKCTRCQRTLPLDVFSQDPSRRDGLRTWCKPCTAERQAERRAADPEYWRAYWRSRYAANPERPRQLAREHYRANPEAARDSSLRSTYGISVADWEAMFVSQGGKCQLCRREPEGQRRLAVDHCHTTGRIRGLLCSYCNTSLGFVESRGLDRIAAYLAGELSPDEEMPDGQRSRQGKQQGEEHPEQGDVEGQAAEGQRRPEAWTEAG